MRTIFFLISTYILCLPLNIYSFYFSEETLIDEGPFFDLVLEEDTIYNKKLFKKRYAFVKRLTEETRYYDALRELEEIKGDFAGKPLLYMDYMSARLKMLISQDVDTNNSIIFQYLSSNENSFGVTTNYFEYMAGEIYRLHTGSELSSYELELVDRPMRDVNLEEAIKLFEVLINSKYRIDLLRQKAILGKAECLLHLNKTALAEAELKYFMDYYPVSNLRMYAYYYMSRVHVQKKNTPMAVAWLIRILREWPRGDHVDYVKLKMMFLAEMKDTEDVAALPDIISRYEAELNVRNELADYLGRMLEKAGQK